MKDTLHFYNTNAEEFVTGTLDVDFHETQDRFLALIPTGGQILDFGCGSGRDTKYFLQRGYTVEATDGSIELCRIASEYTGIQVKHMLFQELDEVEKYDGIWACASILHVPSTELPFVLQKMTKALKADGVIYTSFKYGDFEGERNSRYFTDLTEESFDQILGQVEGLTMEEYWITSDVRPGREKEKWLNLMLRRMPMSDNTIPIFTYGTLMSNQRAAHMLSGYQCLGTFRLLDYATYNVSYYPGIKPVLGECVIGEVYLVDDACIARMDEYEREGDLYIRKLVTVENDETSMEAYVYVYNRDVQGEIVRGKWTGFRFFKSRKRRVYIEQPDAFTPEQMRGFYAKASEVIRQKVEHYAPIVGVDYNRITIRSQRTRWGSCSSKGNLNFNCLLVLFPEDVMDSVVVHELCHRKHMNHSKEFYAELGRVFPDYRRCNQWLKEHGGAYIRRLPVK